jgi:ferrous iron transport protein A
VSSPHALSDLLPGNSARIVQFLDEEISLNMIEMGCIPGTLVTMIRKAPFGDPLAFACHSSIISIRTAEAQTVIVAPENV